MVCVGDSLERVYGCCIVVTNFGAWFRWDCTEVDVAKIHDHYAMKMRGS
jgi:hypothetical protein